MTNAGPISRSLIRQFKQSRLIAVLVGNVGVLGLGLASGVVASRALGPTGRGDYFAVQATAAVIAVAATMGVTQALVTSDEAVESLTGPIILPPLVAGMMGLSLGIVFNVSNHPWLTTSGILGASMLTSAGVLGSFVGAHAQRAGRMKGHFQRARLLPQLAVVVVMLTLWLTGQQSINLWLLVSGVGITLPTLVLFFPIAKRSLGFYSGKRRWVPSVSFRRQASTAWVIAVGSQLLYRADVVVVGTALDSYSIGLYSVGVAAGMAVAGIGQAAGMLAFSDLRRQTDNTEQWAIISRGLLQTVLLTVALTVPVVLLTPWLVHALYGSQFEGSILPARILVVAAVPLSIDYLLTHAALSVGARKQLLWTQALMITLTAILLVAAVQTEDLKIIAGVSLITYPLSGATLWALVRNKLLAPNS